MNSAQKFTLQNWVYRKQLKNDKNTKEEVKNLNANIFESAKKAYECAHANSSRRLMQFLELYISNIVENDKIKQENKIDVIIDLLVNKNQIMISQISDSNLVDQILELLQIFNQNKKARNKKSVLLKKKQLEAIFNKFPYSSSAMTVLCKKYKSKLESKPDNQNKIL